MHKYGLLRITGLRVIVCSLLLLALPARAALLPGAAAPDFTAGAALAGKPVTLTLFDILQKGPVVLWFYPKAFTGGCTKEANLFAEAMPQFAELGATVIGISDDDQPVLQEFSVKEARNAYALVADPDGRVIKAYDVQMLFGASTAKRVTYVITPDGKVFYAYSNMGAAEHISHALAAIRAWKAGQPPPVE